MILKEGINEYLHNIIPDRDEILLEMEAYAKENKFPSIGPQVGQVLMQYAMLTDAKRIFELGSGYGYSAMWFARATSDDCHIYCTDGDPANRDMADEYFKREGITDRVTFLVGDAITQLNSTEG
ncbi:MAG: O-methyltransferase, partial [Candidatus Kariarchaeaceae archaeon]